MQFRKFGKLDWNASVLGFGCMRLPTLGAPDRIDEAAATKLLRRAIEAGVNYVDTAWFYHATRFGDEGQSEPFVGRALEGIWRDKVLLATKMPQQLIREKGQMEDFLARQLERLRTDRIDFYLVHGLDGDSWDRMRVLGVIEFLEDAKRRGLIRYPAFSFHGSQADFPRIVDAYELWAFAQIQYNYMDTDYQAGLSGLRYAAGKGLGVVAMEPLKGGRLAVDLPPEMKAVFDARSERWSPAEWALRYVWDESGVSLLLSGMNSEAQLEENLKVAEESEALSLGEERRAVFEAAQAALRSRIAVDCTACRYCQPCPSAVEIPEVLAALNTASMWGTKDSWLSGYARIKGKGSACSDCGRCEEICPQGLPVRAHLKEATALFGS